MAEEKFHKDAKADELPQEKPQPNLRLQNVFLGACFFATIFLMVLSAVATTSSLFNTFVGFLPLLLTAVLLIFLKEEQFKDLVLWATPFVLGFLFLALGTLINQFLDYQLDVGALTVINIILGLLMVFFTLLFEGKSLFPQENLHKKETVEEYLHSIEDKCKALNFAIGRVYRGSNGGTNALRARIRIEPEWYNTFQEIENMKERKHDALASLHRILDRLMLLAKEENAIFTATEVKNLKNLERNAKGEDKIIDILLVNDRDPVETYYVTAVDATKKLLKAVEAL